MVLPNKNISIQNTMLRRTVILFFLNYKSPFYPHTVLLQCFLNFRTSHFVLVPLKQTWKIRYTRSVLWSSGVFFTTWHNSILFFLLYTHTIDPYCVSSIREAGPIVKFSVYRICVFFKTLELPVSFKIPSIDLTFAA